MNRDRSSAVPWLVGALTCGLLCCLCLAVGLALAAGLTTYRSSSSAPFGPGAAAPLAPATAAAGSGGLWDSGPVTAEAEAMARRLGEVIVPIADPIELAERLQGVRGVSRVLATSAAPVPVGSLEQFWVHNDDTLEYAQVTAEMVYATPHVYFWVQQGVRYDLADVRALVDAFEYEIYPTNRAFFGSEWTPGIDGDPHLYILFSRGMGGNIAGYFGSNDLYPPEISPYSNGHEMFYVSADGQNLRSSFVYGVLAHEFQHMIHWHQDANEDTWLDEGMADLASFLNGYDVGGWDFVYAESPDIPLTFWPSGADSSIHYGQSFLFVLYFLDRFGEMATQALAAHPANGLDSIDRTLAELDVIDPLTGAAPTADEVFRDFAAALLLRDPLVGDGRYSLESYPDGPTLRAKQRFSQCPVGPLEFDVQQFGIDGIGIDCAGEYTLHFQGQPLIPVVPAEPYSGAWAFWSNRGNVSDMTLTRAFDLRPAEGPVELVYQVWFDIEEDWDYAFLELSSDGGQTWEILTTPSGTDSNPFGNSYGWGYTGTSGGGEEPVWVEERVDLSPYAGSQVLLRFEYVTDASVNGEGLLVDDLAIPALGYFEDFEDGDGGWQAEGFVHLYNRIPQTYRLVLVRHGAQATVEEILTDADAAAQAPLTLASGERATLLVIATTRYTWRPAPYQIEIR